MLGLNEKDAQGLLEDVALMHTNRPDSTISAADLYESAMRLRRANRAIQVRDDKLREVGAKLGDLSTEYNDLKAVANASRLVIDALADQFAKALNVAPEVVRKRAYEAMSRMYDREVDEMLSTGNLSKDLRQDPDVKVRKSRDWYSPEI